MHALGHVGFEISGSVAISGNVGHRLIAEGLKGEGVNQKSRVFSADSCRQGRCSWPFAWHWPWQMMASTRCAL